MWGGLSQWCCLLWRYLTQPSKTQRRVACSLGWCRSWQSHCLELPLPFGKEVQAPMTKNGTPSGQEGAAGFLVLSCHSAWVLILIRGNTMPRLPSFWIGLMWLIVGTTDPNHGEVYLHTAVVCGRPMGTAVPWDELMAETVRKSCLMLCVLSAPWQQ